MRVVWSPGALRQIGRIYAYIADFNPSAAARLAAALLAAGDSLSQFPHRGRSVGDNLRELTVVFPYIIRLPLMSGRGSDGFRYTQPILRVTSCGRAADSRDLGARHAPEGKSGL